MQVLVGLSALGLSGWGAVEAYHAVSPRIPEWFEVRHVTVTGIARVARDEVMESIHVSPGETLLSVQPDVLAARLASHPWIKEVEVTRIPFHTLAVHITERQAVALLQTPSHTLLLDEEGRVLSVAEGVDEPTLPILMGIDPARLMRGEPESRQAVRNGIEVASLLEGDFQGRPEVHAGNPSNLTASIGGLRFLLGASPFAEKWDLYRRLRPTLQVAFQKEAATGMREIDLRYPNKVIVRERG